MDIKQQESLLHRHIPPTERLAVSLVQAGAEQVVLQADFEANRNHHHTVFGGSISLVATTCAWLLAHLNFPQAEGNIVIRESQCRFLAPARGDLQAASQPLSPQAKAQCEKMLAKFGKGGLDLSVKLFSQGKQAAEFQGKFVVFQPNKET